MPLRITYPMILKKLGYRVVYRHLGSPDVEIRAVEGLDSRVRDIDPQVLYVLERPPEPPDPPWTEANLVCIARNSGAAPGCRAVPAGRWVRGFPGMNVVVVETSCGASEMIRQIREIMAEYYRWGDELLEAVVRQARPAQLLDIGYRAIRHPLVLLDRSMKVLAHAGPSPGDDLWRLAAEVGYLPARAGTYAGLEEILSEADRDGRPVRCGDEALGPFLCQKVPVGGHATGYLFVLEADDPITGADEELCSYLSRMLSLALGKDDFVRVNREAAYHSLLLDLLEGKTANRDEVDQRLKNLHLTLRNNLYVLVTRAENPADGSERLDEVRKELSGVLGDALSVMYAGELVALIHTVQDRALDTWSEYSLTRFLRAHGLKAGLSRRFLHLIQMVTGYRQARNAMDVGSRVDRDRVLFAYDDYTLYHALEVLSRQHDPRGFCHPSLLKLIEYDAARGTSLTDTLHAYVTSGGSQTAAARRLHIHRSTLIYRLNRIRDIMEVNLDDGDVMFHLQLSFRLLRYANVLGPEERAVPAR